VPGAPTPPAVTTAPLPAVPAAPEIPAGPPSSAEPGRRAVRLRRQAAGGLAIDPAQARGGSLAGVAAAVIVASVVPLALLQVPNVIAGALPAAALTRLGGAAGVVRAAGLALPTMACVAPMAAVLARRHRAWPSLLAGLAVLGAADLLGNSAHSVLAVGVDRVLHGAGAGLALPASLALAWERPPRWRRVLARWWVAVAVFGLLAAAPVLRERLAGGDWRAALQPAPWLTAVALAGTAVYVALTGGSGPPPRSVVTPAERSQLGLIAVPLAGLAALDVGVSSQLVTAVTVTAGVAVVILASLAAATSADAVTGGDRVRLCFPLTAACAGFAVVPTAATIAALRSQPRPLGLPLAAAAAACLLSVVAGWWRAQPGTEAGAAGTGLRAGVHAARHKGSGRRTTRPPRGGDQSLLATVLTGLTCTAVGLGLARMVGPAAGPGLLAVVYVLLAGGQAVALSAGVVRATPAGAMAGLSLAVAGALTGYLVAAAIQIRLTGPAAASRSAAGGTAVHALAGVAGWWELAAVVMVAATAGGVWLLGRTHRRREAVAARG